MKPVCLVLGAGAGIGGTVAKKFALEGYHSCLCRRSDQDGLDRLVSNIEEKGGSATGYLIKAIEENVRKKVQKMTKQKPWHVEQDNKADWILMDYSDIILHIFQEETRSFYNLEELWGDAKKTSHN